MSQQIDVYPKALADISEIGTYLGDNAGLDMELRFLDAIDRCFEELVALPMLGAARPSSNPVLTGLRKWRVKEFDKILVFYKPSESGIEVVRVLHGARDIEALLLEE